MSSDSTLAELTVSQTENGVEINADVSEFSADVARQYAEQAEESAAEAKNSQNLSEAWAESSAAPAGEGTRSSKTWSDVSRQWAESDTEPDDVEGARSSKTWADVARQWAESDEEPDGVSGAKSSKTWAEESAASAAAALASENAAKASEEAALASEEAAKASETAAKASQDAAKTSETNAKASEDAAAESLAQMVYDLTLKADVESPALTGTPKAPTAELGTNTTQIATTAFVAAAIAALASTAPDTLDTLKELADALGNDPNFAATMTAELAKKLNISGGTMTGALTLSADPTADLGAATKQYVDNHVSSGSVSSAAKLTTARSFYVADATAAHTGAAVSFDGSANVTLKLPATITAAVIGNVTGNVSGSSASCTGNAATATKATSDSNGNNIASTYAPKASPTFTGTATAAAMEVTGALTVGGNITATGTITGSKVYSAVYNDYAEFFQRGEDCEAGDIIALDETADTERYVKATEDSTVVIGVCSHEFAHVIGGMEPPEGEDFVAWNEKNYIPVALAGRVYVRVYGRVSAGDWIVPSGIPGVGRAAEDGESLVNAVGRVVTPDENAENIRKVRILVK